MYHFSTPYFCQIPNGEKSIFEKVFIKLKGIANKITSGSFSFETEGAWRDMPPNTGIKNETLAYQFAAGIDKNMVGILAKGAFQKGEVDIGEKGGFVITTEFLSAEIIAGYNKGKIGGSSETGYGFGAGGTLVNIGTAFSKEFTSVIIELNVTVGVQFAVGYRKTSDGYRLRASIFSFDYSVVAK